MRSDQAQEATGQGGELVPWTVAPGARLTLLMTSCCGAESVLKARLPVTVCSAPAHEPPVSRMLGLAQVPMSTPLMVASTVRSTKVGAAEKD